MLSFIKRIRSQHIFIFLVLLGAFLRLYRLRETMQFMGDQGRDALIVRRMLIEHHPALIGPVTSVGNMYLGPFYYYFMLVPLMITYPDPSGPAFAVALVGVATLVLIYKLGKRMVGERAALIALALYAVSPLAINTVRFSWNPNIVPFFSLLMIWQIYNAWRGKYGAWVWIGLFFSILIQLHYITLIMGAFAGIVWILQLIQILKKKKNAKEFFIATGIAILIFLVSLTPLVAFDVRHGHVNEMAFASFFTHNGDHFLFLTALKGIITSSLTLFVRNFLSLFRLTVTGTTKLLAFLFFAGSLVWFARKKKGKYIVSERLLLLFFIFSCGILSLYRLTIYDHYLGFLYPMSALLLGVILAHLSEIKLMKPFVGIALLVAVIFSLANTPFKENLGYNIDMMKRTADAIQTHVVLGTQYNIFLYSPSLDFQGMNYRYFLTTGKQAPVSEDEFFNFPTLFVLDDLHDKQIFDTHHYMFAIWPNKQVVDKFSIPGGPEVSVLKR